MHQDISMQVIVMNSGISLDLTDIISHAYFADDQFSSFKIDGFP